MRLTYLNKNEQIDFCRKYTAPISMCAMLFSVQYTQDFIITHFSCSLYFALFTYGIVVYSREISLTLSIIVRNIFRNAAFCSRINECKWQRIRRQRERLDTQIVCAASRNATYLQLIVVATCMCN